MENKITESEIMCATGGAIWRMIRHFSKVGISESRPKLTN